MSEGLNKRCCTFFLSFVFSLFISFRYYQYTALGSSAEDNHQMYYSRRSVVGEASLILSLLLLPRRKFRGNHHHCCGRHWAVLMVLSAYVWPQTKIRNECNSVHESFDTLSFSAFVFFECCAVSDSHVSACPNLLLRPRSPYPNVLEI